MTKVEIENMEGREFKKFYGVFDAKIIDAKFEKRIAKTAKKTEYFNLELDVEIEQEKIVQRKIFFRLPFDAWNKESLFNQLKTTTELSTDECMDSDSYKGKKIKVVIGPEKDQDGNWKTYTDKRDIKRTSYGIIKIVSRGVSKTKIESIEKEIEDMIALTKTKDQDRLATEEDLHF